MDLDGVLIIPKYSTGEEKVFYLFNKIEVGGQMFLDFRLVHRFEHRTIFLFLSQLYDRLNICNGVEQRTWPTSLVQLTLAFDTCSLLG